MTLTTDVRINYPINAEALLDHVTVNAMGDPSTVARRSWRVGDEWYGDEVRPTNGIANKAGQGLMTLACVEWAEGDIQDEFGPCPPACVVLSIDNPYGYGDGPSRGRWVQANVILPAVRDWLDAQGVPRDAWWWEDETAGTWHPGAFDVTNLDTTTERPVWQAA